MSPSTDGYYWLIQKDSFGKPMHAEIVRVAFGYTFRRKVVPFVISTIWRAPLSDMRDCEWDGPLQCPIK